MGGIRGSLSGARTTRRDDGGGDRVSLSGTRRNDALVLGTRRNAEKCGQVFSPNAKVTCSNALRIVHWVIENAKDLVGEKLSDGEGHSGKALHKEVDRLLSEKIKRRTGPLGGVCPGIVVVQHVDEHNAKGPNIGATGTIRRRNIVPAFVAHVGSTAAVHVGRFTLGGRKAEVREFYDNFTFLGAVWQSDPAIGDDKVFWLDITMIDLLSMTGSYCIAHLSEHWRDEAKASAWEELRRVEGGEKAGGGRGVRRRNRVIRSWWIRVVMIAGLLQKVEEILSGDVFQQQEQEGFGLKGTMQSDDIWVRMKRLMNGDLWHLSGQSFLVKVCFWQTLYSEITTEFDWRACIGVAIEIHRVQEGQVAIFRGKLAVKNLTYEIDDCVTAGTETSDDLKFFGRLLAKRECWGRGYEMDWLSLEEATLTDEVTWSKDIVKRGRDGGGGSVVGGGAGGGVGVGFYWERRRGRGSWEISG
jgi:hypothetical protein